MILLIDPPTLNKAVKAVYDGYNETITPLKENGSFDSKECLEILSKCDVVITNPPFSKSRFYVDTMMKSGKKVLFINNPMVITTRFLKDYILNKQLWLGYNRDNKLSYYYKGELKKINSYWYTNLDVNYKYPELNLTCKYDPSHYPQDDNFKRLIYVNHYKEIPADYDGLMAVSISFLPKLDPKKFDLIDICGHCLYIKGQQQFKKLIIRYHTTTLPPRPVFHRD